MDDLISRQAAIDEIKALYEWHDTVTEDRTIDHLKRLPSAQPDIIHCGECKYYDDSDGCFFSTATTGADGFCHWAERKEGEADEAD